MEERERQGPQGLSKKAKAKKRKLRDDPEHDLHLPSRPLTAYNFFFREEREKVIRELTANEQEKNGDNQSSKSAEDSQKVDGRRALFENAVKIVASRWKSLPASEAERYKKLAERDKERYRAEIEAYYKQVTAKLRTDQDSSSIPVMPPESASLGDVATAAAGEAGRGAPPANREEYSEESSRQPLSSGRSSYRALSLHSLPHAPAADVASVPDRLQRAYLHMEEERERRRDAGRLDHPGIRPIDHRSDSGRFPWDGTLMGSSSLNQQFMQPAAVGSIGSGFPLPGYHQQAGNMGGGDDPPSHENFWRPPASEQDRSLFAMLEAFCSQQERNRSLAHQTGLHWASESRATDSSFHQNAEDQDDVLGRTEGAAGPLGRAEDHDDSLDVTNFEPLPLIGIPSQPPSTSSPSHDPASPSKPKRPTK